jgi:tRNA A-37 threonylcarbamoyl transferase component Bud32
MKNKVYSNQLNIGEVSISKEISGGNSSVFKGILNDGTKIAIKKYNGDKQRVERMLCREHEAIDFLHKNGVFNTPEILEVRKDLGLIVFRWIEGVTPSSDRESINAILEMCKVLNEIYTNGSVFEYAIDSGFSGRDIESQIRRRIQQLKTLYPLVWMEDVTDQIRQRLDVYSSDPQTDVIFHQRTFSFSDLGTHNMIYSDGKFNFIDFEFFGTDSVNKLVGDFLLHPKNDFNEFETTHFIELSNQIFEWRLEELVRFIPLLALKWAVIAYGRTLRNLQEKVKDGVSKHDVVTSNWALYLKYFDWLCLSGNTEKFTTFHAFEGMVNR